MTVNSKLAAASLALFCVAALAQQSASASGGAPPHFWSRMPKSLPTASVQRHWSHLPKALPSAPAQKHWSRLPQTLPSASAPSRSHVIKNVPLHQSVSPRIGALTNPGVRHALNPGAILVPAHPPGNGGLIVAPPSGSGAGVMPPAGGAATGGGGSGSGLSVMPQGPGFDGANVAGMLPSAGSNQPVASASRPVVQPLVAGAGTAAAPITPPNPCSCVTKTTLADGSVLFRDVCTNQSAVAPAAKTLVRIRVR